MSGNILVYLSDPREAGLLEAFQILGYLVDCAHLLIIQHNCDADYYKFNMMRLRK